MLFLLLHISNLFNYIYIFIFFCLGLYNVINWNMCYAIHDIRYTHITDHRRVPPYMDNDIWLTTYGQRYMTHHIRATIYDYAHMINHISLTTYDQPYMIHHIWSTIYDVLLTILRLSSVVYGKSYVVTHIWLLIYGQSYTTNPIGNSHGISERYMLNHIWLVIYGEPYMTPFVIIYGHWRSCFFYRIWWSIYA